MINQSYRLTSPRVIKAELIDEKLKEDDLIVRPTYLSICAADMRYYTGNRDKNALKKKLPMALIHEAVGQVIYDPKGKIPKGTKVVMIPNTPIEKDEIIKENYLRTSSFKSSGIDGFMQGVVFIRRDRVIPFEKIPERTAVLLELMSVGMNAIDKFEKVSHKRKEIIGLWGDGNVGYALAVILKNIYPNSKLIVFGAMKEKLDYFSFADETYLVSDDLTDIKVDHAFECVGGRYSEDAINQIIDLINPEGTISLMGVSENKVPINTRMVLEKGLTIIGNSRSSYEDFKKCVDLLEKNEKIAKTMEKIISDEILVKTIKDMTNAFDKDSNNAFKTIMKWEI